MGKKPLVLIVDDNPTIRLMLKKSLTGVGLDIIEADNGENAINAFEEFIPDAILMDVNMPVMDGFTACQKIRELPSGKYVAIMMLTVQDDMDSINQSYQVGATDFATKPFNNTVISQRVLYMIRNSNILLELDRSTSKIINANKLALLGSWSWDVNEKEFTWSNELYGLVGREPDAALIAKKHILEYVHPEDKSRVQQYYDRCIQNQELFTLDYRIIDCHGNVKYMHELTDVLTDKNGKVSSIYGYVQDVTKLKKAELELKKLNEELEQRVIQRTEQLQAANTYLQQTLDELKATQDKLIESERIASLGKLVAGIAHEINTPLGIGVGAVSHVVYCMAQYQQHHLHETEADQSLLDTSNEALKLAEINLERAAKLVKHFKQVAVDNLQEERRKINFNDYLHEIFFSVKPKLIKAKITATIHCADDIELDSYPGAIFQLITILIINVVDHAYPDERGGKILIECKVIDDSLSIEFSDFGLGIEQQYIKRIFDPFFTIGSKADSIGLGLNIAHNIVSQTLQGTISCESEIHKGTKFLVKFPLVTKENKAVKAVGSQGVH